MKNLERDDNDYADNDEEYKVPENQLIKFGFGSTPGARNTNQSDFQY